jgi:hypothetical protein
MYSIYISLPTEVVLQDLVVVLFITSTIFPKWHYATVMLQDLVKPSSPNGTTSDFGHWKTREEPVVSKATHAELLILCNSERLIAAARPV